MNIVRPYPYRTLDRITRADGVRHYVCPDTGALLPSVTTILAATSDDRWLLEWRARVGERRADRIRDDACALGTLMHTHLENHVLGIPRPRGNNLVRVAAERMSDVVIQKGLCHVDEVWGLEVALHAPGLYAGTTDLVGRYQGVPAICDYKTTKTMKTRADIQDYMIQASAYCVAHNALHGTDISTCVVFMVARDLSFRTFVLRGAEFDRAVAQWEQRVVEYCQRFPPGLQQAAQIARSAA